MVSSIKKTYEYVRTIASMENREIAAHYSCVRGVVGRDLLVTYSQCKVVECLPGDEMMALEMMEDRTLIIQRISVLCRICGLCTYPERVDSTIL